jgi:hypothetical protein
MIPLLLHDVITGTDHNENTGHFHCSAVVRCLAAVVNKLPLLTGCLATVVNTCHIAYSMHVTIYYFLVGSWRGDCWTDYHSKTSDLLNNEYSMESGVDARAHRIIFVDLRDTWVDIDMACLRNKDNEHTWFG